jgi:cytochrome P450
MKILLCEGLITSDGEVHRRQRRIAAPAFHRQRIQAYGGMMVDRAAGMCAEWKAAPLDIAAQMMQLTLQIVARTLFNTDVTSDVLQINDQVNVIMELYNYLIALPRAEAYLHLPVPGLMRFRRARGRLDAVVQRMIAQHRADGIDRGDLLSMLLASRDDEADHSGMTDEQLRDQVLTIFLAGYETVANALTWTWYLLSQNPEAEARFHAEIDEVLSTGPAADDCRLPGLDDLPRLRYTEMVFAESMRLYPPAWAMGRQSIADVELGPYRFPSGTYFFFSQYIIQRSAENFPDPLRFDPDRFLPEQKASRPRFAYFPFGGGGRQCIGEAFAWMEGVLLLATIGQQWRLRFIPGQAVDVQPKITLRPKYPMMMLPEKRPAFRN